MNECAVTGCTRSARARGWCNAHYLRWQRHGDPLAGGATPGGGTPYERVVGRLVADGDCCVFAGAKSGGYGRVRDHGQTLLAHVVVWEHHNGPVPADGVVMHACDNPACCRIEHLSVGTQIDNLADMVGKKRHARGHRAGGAKLTADQVRAIRADERISPLIAADYGVHERHVRLIKEGKTWRHIQ